MSVVDTANAARVVLNNKNKPVNNIINGIKLREVQKSVLRNLKDAIVHSMGPAGSNSLILRGNDDQSIVAEYSKDGNKIIKNIKYQYPIEMAVKSEIENATRHIEKTVGDGTSSVVVMSSYIFDSLVEADEQGKLPTSSAETVRLFKEAVSKISKKIRDKSKECTLDDIYNIALISSNNNKDLANQIRDIYDEYGMDVFIDVSASTDGDTYVKSYNGITIDVGYSDPCMINNLERNSARIRSTDISPVRVYHFQDPIDNVEMSSYFEQIIEDNIINRRNNQGMMEYPTVILAPKIGRDVVGYMRRIVQMMHSFGEEMYSQKPQLLIVTNYMGLDENYVDHISQLCGCKPIRKYIDDRQQKLDQDNGIAPTLQNVSEFYGMAGEVEADSSVTKFIDPWDMYTRDDSGSIVFDEHGNPETSTTYDNIVRYLEAEYKLQKSTGGNAGSLGALKRQLNAIKANMIELFIGGISISDRDSYRDLVEDAVLNTRSAATNGVGYGTNTMGYMAAIELRKEEPDNIIYNIIEEAYLNTIGAIYSTCYTDDEVDIIIKTIETNGIPLNISTGEYDGKVLTSIESDPAILDTISKIIGVMFTANQALLQAPTLTQHY